MSEEILKRLDALAAALGTTAEYLMNVLTERAIARAYGCMFLAMVGLALLLLGRYLILKGGGRPCRVDGYGRESWQDSAVALVVFGGGSCLIGLTTFTLATYDAIVCFISPEGEAVRQIIELFSGQK